MEQGEIEASPYHSPYLDIGVYGDHMSDDGDSRRGRSPRGEENSDEALGPDIKPPQAKVKKDKHKHKHKRDKRKTGERERHSDRGDKSREKSRGGSNFSGSSKHWGAAASSGSRGSGKERRDRPPKELNERDHRSRQQMQQRSREELSQREWSQKERERLEQLEKERIRIEKMREQEHHNKLRYEWASKERRPTTRHEVGNRRGREKVSSSGRSRSPYQRRGVEAPPKGVKQRSRAHDRHADESPRHHQLLSRHEQMDQRRGQVQGRKEEVVEEREVEEQVVEPEPHEAESSEDSESDSDDSTSGESDSESDSSSDDNQERGKEENNHSVHPDKMKSRFDSESEPEPMENSDSGHHSDHDQHYLDDSPVPSSPELLPDLPPYYPAIQGCRNVDEFSCLNRIEEGTYGVVYRAMDKKTKEIVALKRLKMEKEKEGFPITSLREISTLLKAQHSNIVTVREIVVGSNMDRIYIVMDYVEHDLKALMETMKEPFIVGEVKTLMIQLLRGVNHLHDNWIIHRDLKTSNLLLSHSGILKIGDFGLAREYGSPLKSYTPIVVTLWYRAPELLLGTKEYSCPIDMWSVGCIMAEFLTRKPLFPGKTEIDELNKIFKELGTPNEKIWPGVTELKGWKTCNFTEYPYNQLRNKFGGLLTDTGFELLNRFLTYNPQRRISAIEALDHSWFKESPRPVNPSMFPTWPAKSEQTHRKSHGNSPKPPSGGKAYNQLLGDEDEKIGLAASAGGFHLGGSSKTEGGGFSLKF